MNIELLNGQRLGSDGQWHAFKSIRIAEGKIVAIDEDTAFEADTTIEVDGAYVLPGLIDLNVSLREPGFHMKGSVASETNAAAAGGVTTICSAPDTDPVNDSEAVTKLIVKLAKSSSKCRVFPLGAMTANLEGERLSEYAALKEAGCIALSNGFNSFKNLSIAKRCFEYAKTQGLSVFVNPIEPSLHKGSMHEGVMSTTIGLQGIPSIAETVPVAQLIQLAKATGVHLHLSQLSAADSVSQVALAKEAGINVTADTALHNLLLTDENLVDFNSQFHCLPPLREETDRLALIEGVKSGAIDCITSQHQPHEAAAKLLPFSESATGISGVELLLPLANKLAQAGELELIDFIQSMTKNAAKVIGVDCISLEEGQIANVCIFDPNVEWTVSEEIMLSQGKNSPYLGQALKGKVVTTIFEGKLSYQS